MADSQQKLAFGNLIFKNPLGICHFSHLNTGKYTLWDQLASGHPLRDSDTGPKSLH